MKNIIVTSEKTSSWVSCQVISPNLIKAYQRIIPESELLIVDYANKQFHYELMELGRRIFELRPEKLIFVDHAPHPLKLLQILDHLYGQEKRPELFFHVFGDFTLYANDWIELEGILQKFQVTFFAASERQKALVQNFCQDFSHKILCCPFPVDEDQYFFSPELREKCRKEWKIPSNEYIFIYTGRLSEQKNIIGLVLSFNEWIKKMQIPARLYLAGEFDDLGVPYLGTRRPRNFFFQLWTQEISKLDKEVQERIIYLGNLNSQKLLELCHLGDCYVSLSTHNDEDFGMAPAEALLTGTQAILSDWAGYASFAGPATSLVPVSFEQHKIQVHYQNFQKELFKISAELPTNDKRKALAAFYKERFGVEAVAKLLKNYHLQKGEKFTSFTRHFHNLRMAFLTSPESPFLLRTPSYNKSYGNIYAPYFKTFKENT